MKKVKLKEIIERNGEYQVFLYPSRRIIFKSKTKAEIYLRQESKILTTRLYKDLEVYRMLQNSYLSNWGTFKRHQSLTIEEDLATVWSLFDRAVYRSIDNYNTVCFIEKAERTMFSILGIMRHEAKKNSNTPMVYSLDTISSFIEGNHEIEEDNRHWSVTANVG